MSTVVITYDGNDISANVVFSTARFESSVNGAPGPASFRVRDLNLDATYSIGKEVTLTIDGELAWSGISTIAKRVYIFPALDLAESGMSRWWDIEATDWNILFSKRFVFNQGEPENTYGTLFPPGTADDVAIADLVANFLDLTGDGIDTSSLVENVADITINQSGRAWSAADQWGQAMQSIARLPGAIYYINPGKKLVYTDVDSPNAPFGLSDIPDATHRGFREMDILLDGTGLANDVLGWGIGYGSNAPVFDRLIDPDSFTEHGRWQQGKTYFGVYKQATLDANVNSIVYGSPENLRGAKDDKVAVTLVTYEPGLRAAQKVPFVSNAFGFSDVIPVRKMTVTFDAPDTPKYDLVLSHDIDAPYSIIDNFFLNPWELKCPYPFVPGPNGTCILPPTFPPIAICTDATRHTIIIQPTPGDWVLVDDFDRDVSPTYVVTGTPEGEYWGSSTDGDVASAPYMVNPTPTDGGGTGYYAGVLGSGNISSDTTGTHVVYNAFGQWQGWVYQVFSNDFIAYEVEVNYDDTLTKGGSDDTVSWRSQRLFFGPWSVSNRRYGPSYDPPGFYVRCADVLVYGTTTPSTTSGTQVFRMEYDRLLNEANFFIGGVPFGTVDMTGHFVAPNYTYPPMRFQVSPDTGASAATYGGDYGMRVNFWRAFGAGTPGSTIIYYQAVAYVIDHVFVMTDGLPAIPEDYGGLTDWRDADGFSYTQSNPSDGIVTFTSDPGIGAEVIMCTTVVAQSGHLSGPGADEPHGGFNLNTLVALDVTVPTIVRLTVNEAFPTGWFLGILNESLTSDQSFFEPVAGTYLIAIQSIPDTWYIYAWSADDTYDPDLAIDVDYETWVGGASSLTVNAYVTQEFTASGSATFTLAGSFLPRSALASINGLLQRTGIDYTEDPSAGTITFDETPVVGSVIRVSYFNLG